MRPYYLFALLAIAAASRAQPVIVPNLGQWTGGFRAKTALTDGAIFWTDHGYRIRVVHPKHRGGAVANPHYPTTQWPEHWPDAHALFVEFVGGMKRLCHVVTRIDFLSWTFDRIVAKTKA